MNYKELQAYCFIGHRHILISSALIHCLLYNIEHLIRYEGVDTFLFGSKSQFDNICHRLVTTMQRKYPHIKRIYVRAEAPQITDAYRKYLLENYEDTYYPASVAGAGKASYLKRNCAMIDNCKFCIFYYDASYIPPRRKNSTKDKEDYQPQSGTQRAYLYALKKGKEVINVGSFNP